MINIGICIHQQQQQQPYDIYGGGGGDVAKALVYAASEETVELNGVYILVRREPSVLKQAAATMTLTPVLLS